VIPKIKHKDEDKEILPEEEKPEADEIDTEEIVSSEEQAKNREGMFQK
jgi:hypothetical protein